MVNRTPSMDRLCQSLKLHKVGQHSHFGSAAGGMLSCHALTMAQGMTNRPFWELLISTHFQFRSTTTFAPLLIPANPVSTSRGMSGVSNRLRGSVLSVTYKWLWLVI